MITDQVKGLPESAIKDASGKRTTPQKMRAERKEAKSAAHEGIGDAESGVRLPARSSMNERPAGSKF